MSIAMPKEWIAVQVPEVDTKLCDGYRISIPIHTIEVAYHCPTTEDSIIISGVSQTEAVQFLRDYNESRKTFFSVPTLAEDEAIRALGRDHDVFDENFQRNGKSLRWDYLMDFNRPYGSGAEGIGQSLVTRLVGYSLNGGDVELGVTTIAPEGMVPTLTREQLEKMIKAKGLKRLEKLRGKEIYEKGEEIVDVKNALGYPQFTLGHDLEVIPHSHVVYTPHQNSPERIGVRGASRHRHNYHGCFDIYLGIDPNLSYSDWSIPLVRGGVFNSHIVNHSDVVFE